MDLQLLDRTLTELGEPSYRARQIWRWAASGAESFDAMTDLPLGLRGALAELAVLVLLHHLAVVDVEHLEGVHRDKNGAGVGLRV